MRAMVDKETTLRTVGAITAVVSICDVEGANLHQGPASSLPFCKYGHQCG